MFSGLKLCFSYWNVGIAFGIMVSSLINLSQQHFVMVTNTWTWQASLRTESHWCVMCVQGSESGSCSWSDSDSDSGSSSCSSGSACSSGRSSHTHQTFSIRETNFDQVCNISSSFFFNYFFLYFSSVLLYEWLSMIVVQGYRFRPSLPKAWILACSPITNILWVLSKMQT